MQALIAIALLILLTVVPLSAGCEEHGCGPDSVYIPGRGYVNERDNTVYPRGVLPQPKFGTYTPAPKIKPVPVRAPKPQVVSGFGLASATGARAVEEAKRYMGMTGAQLGVVHRGLWCGEFLGRIADRVGMRKPGNPNMAGEWIAAGTRVARPQVGAIALVGGGKKHVAHVGIVSGITPAGDPILVSGNYNNRVAEATYSHTRIVAYVLPN